MDTILNDVDFSIVKFDDILIKSEQHAEHAKESFWFGIPDTIVSDNGTQFTIKKIQRFL